MYSLFQLSFRARHADITNLSIYHTENLTKIVRTCWTNTISNKVLLAICHQDSNQHKKTMGMDWKCPDKRTWQYYTYNSPFDTGRKKVAWMVSWFFNVPATIWCISGKDLHRQLYVLPHWDRSCRSNFLPHPVTVYWHRADQSQCWPYNARRLAG